MQVHDEADGTLVLTYDSSAFMRFLFIVTAVLVGVALYDYFIGARGTDRLIGLLAGAATCAISGMVFFERAHVVVSPSTQTITWSRQWGFRSRSGSIPFDQVASVLAERPIGDEGVPSRRVVVCTKGGEQVPLTVGYRPDGDEAILGASQRISAILGHTAAASTAGSVQALVSSGRVIDAIKLLRETEGLSLEEAKRRVDAARSGRS